MVFCPNCGKEVSEEDSFCRNCGKTLQWPTVQKIIAPVLSGPEIEQVQSVLSKHIREGEKFLWSSKPEKIPWGYQVQDGGAVLGFSYHDLMSRLIVDGADDAWLRWLLLDSTNILFAVRNSMTMLRRR